MRVTLMPLWAAVAALSAAGCGSESKVAGPPDSGAIAADKAQQKQIEDEERGTPVKKGQRR